MFTLRQLQAQFLRYEVRIEPTRRVKPEVWAVNKTGPYKDDDIHEVVGPVEYHVYVNSLADAHGISFLCPKCYAANNGPVGTHTCICWFWQKVPDEVTPNPGRWLPKGTGYDDLSFVPHVKSNSVLLTGGCQWHGFVTNGKAG